MLHAAEAPAIIPESVSPRGLIEKTNTIQWTVDYDIPVRYGILKVRYLNVMVDEMELQYR